MSKHIRLWVWVFLTYIQSYEKVIICQIYIPLDMYFIKVYIYIYIYIYINVGQLLSFEQVMDPVIKLVINNTPINYQPTHSPNQQTLVWNFRFWVSPGMCDEPAPGFWALLKGQSSVVGPYEGKKERVFLMGTNFSHIFLETHERDPIGHIRY
jgi:hypothetical protein